MKQRLQNFGFTLVELMVVMLFLSIIGVYTWTYLRTTLNTQKIIEDKISIQQQGLSVMSKIQEDVSQVFFVDSYQKLTYFNGEPTTLSFSSLSHDAPNPEDRESEEAQITYTVDSDPDASDSKILLRKEVPFLDGEQEKNDEYLPLTVAKQIENLEFAYTDDGVKFVNEWNTSNPDNLGKLPKLIRLRMTLKDANGREEFFESLMDLPMSEDLNVRAQPTKTGTPTSEDSKKTTKTNPGAIQPTQPAKGGTSGTH